MDQVKGIITRGIFYNCYLFMNLTLKVLAAKTNREDPSTQFSLHNIKKHTRTQEKNKTNKPKKQKSLLLAFKFWEKILPESWNGEQRPFTS